MKILYYKVGESPREIEVEDKLKELQGLVGGYIEVFPLTGDVLLVCDEEGKLKRKSLNAIVSVGGIREYIMGDFFICGSNGGEFRSLTSKEKEEVVNYIQQNI